MAVESCEVISSFPVDVDAPIIFLGRGGSGTRLLSAIAVQNGVFIGNELNATGDSVEWVADIYRLAMEACFLGGALSAERDAYWCANLRRTATQILSRATLAPGDKWGWKLPETILALPHILKAFPRARVIHLTRHPFTCSLRRTHMTSRLDNPIGASVLPAAYKAIGRAQEAIFTDEPYLHNAVTWAYQVGGACRVLDARGELYHTLRYEDVCANPNQARHAIMDFIGSNERNSDDLMIDRGRMNDIDSTDNRLEPVWKICSEVAFRLGYLRTNPYQV